MTSRHKAGKFFVIVIVFLSIKWLITLIFRFVTGRAITGYRKTDATFFRSGSVKFNQVDRVTRWGYLPEWKRAAVRLGSLSSGVIWLFSYLTSPFWTLIVSGIIILGLLTWLGFIVKTLVIRWRLKRTIVGPLYSALRQFGVQHPDWIHIPPKYLTDKTANVVLRLPDEWIGNAEQRTAVFGLVQRKIGGQWEARWTDVGRPQLRMTHAPTPPERVLFADVMSKIMELEPGKLLLGLGSRGAAEVIDLEAETPHVALSMGTGAGKSATLCLLCVQLLAQDADVDGIDPKMVSLNPLRGLPGMSIHRTIAGQWAAIEAARTEMDRRYVELDQNEFTTFRRRVIILEEGNTFYLDSMDYWEEIKPKGAPRIPRIFKDLNKILNKGRQVGVNIIAVYQRADAQSTGGGSARDQYGTKILARFSPQAWKMLVDTYPRPKSSKRRGRVIVTDGGDYRIAQVAYCLDGSRLADIARLYVETTRPAHPLALPVPLSHVSHQLPDQGKQGPTVLVSLTEAVEHGTLDMSIGTARKCRTRDPEFPKHHGRRGRELLYDPEELNHWNRNRARVATG